MSKPVLVEISARHVHVSQADLETLFGKGYQLTKKKDLSQPGQFACEERVDVVGPKKTLARPPRDSDRAVPHRRPFHRGRRPHPGVGGRGRLRRL